MSLLDEPVVMSERLVPVPSTAPQRGNTFSKCLGLWLMRLTGWRIRGSLPNTGKAVVIVAPHTSNFDGFVTVIAMLALGLRISFFVKHTAFRWPFGGLMRWFGALLLIAAVIKIWWVFLPKNLLKNHNCG